MCVGPQVDVATGVAEGGSSAQPCHPLALQIQSSTDTEPDSRFFCSGGLVFTKNKIDSVAALRDEGSVGPPEVINVEASPQAPRCSAPLLIAPIHSCNRE